MFGRHAEAPPPPTPDPEDVVRIGGIKITVAASTNNEVIITLYDKRIHHNMLFTVINAHLHDKGYAVDALHSQINPNSPAQGWADFPTTITLSTASPEASAPTAAQVEAECKSLAAQIGDTATLTAAFHRVEQQRRNAAIAERFRQQGGHNNRGA